MATNGPKDDKEHHLASAPPPYADSMHASNYNGDSTNGHLQYAPTLNNSQPTQVIVVQGDQRLPSTPCLGRRSVYLKCPTCKTLVTTIVEEESSTLAYILGAVLCAIGCCLFSWVPCFLDQFNVFNHSCSNCHAFIGTYKTG